MYDGLLTIRPFSRTNKTRAERWHEGGLLNAGWTIADWSNAMAGEAGELCNIIKKLRRDELGMNGNKMVPATKLLEKAAMEIGDTFIYLDLLASALGLSIEDCIIKSFNDKSDELGFPEKAHN
jgi:NTP pyrophosphatase (non-canonical NTP hydrolase)